MTAPGFVALPKPPPKVKKPRSPMTAGQKHAAEGSAVGAVAVGGAGHLVARRPVSPVQRAKVVASQGRAPKHLGVAGTVWSATYQGKEHVRNRQPGLQGWESGAPKSRYRYAYQRTLGQHSPAATMRAAVANAPKTDQTHYRGVAMSTKDLAGIQSGATTHIHMPISSFTHKEHIARTFATRSHEVSRFGRSADRAAKAKHLPLAPQAGDSHRVVFHVQPGAHHAPIHHAVGPLAAMGEHVGGGSYKVVGYEAKRGSGVHVVHLQHVARLGGEAVRVAKTATQVGKSQLMRVGEFGYKGGRKLGYKAITAMSRAERAELRHQLSHAPVGRVKEDAERSNEVRNNIAEQTPEMLGEQVRSLTSSGQALGAAYRAGPGKAKIRLARPEVFTEQAAIHTPPVTARYLRQTTLTHEQHHAKEFTAEPRRELLREHYEGVYRPKRAAAKGAAREGRAVGHTNQVHGPTQTGYDPLFTSGKAMRSVYGISRRQTRAYQAGKEHPNTLLRQYRRDQKGKFSKVSGETPTARYQRHQKQAGAALTAAAAVPALLALRSGRMASTAMAAGDTARHGIHAASQLKHAASATALGGLAGGVNALPTPKKFTVQRTRKGAKPAGSYTRNTIGKALSPGFDESAARERHRASEQIRAGKLAQRRSAGFGGRKPGAAPHYGPSTAQRAASAGRREDQAVARAARPYVRVPTAVPPLRAHLAGGQIRDAAIAAGAVGAAAGYLHHRSLSKAADHDQEVAGAVIGGAGVRTAHVVGGQATKAGLKVHRAKVGTSPMDAQTWARHKASYGVRGPMGSAIPNKTKVAIHASYPKTLPGWRVQRALALKNRPSFAVATIGAGAASGAALARHHQQKEG